MSKAGKIFLLLGVLLGVVMLFAWAPLSRFLFHPEGLSLAASQLCLVNKSDGDLVVEIDVSDGAKSITLLGREEKGCSAAPKAGLAGRIVVSEKEGGLPNCVGQFQAGETIEISGFSPNDNCGWKS